ncbi:MAG TPA: hypothetical protein VEQ11_14920 [Chloroflexota bacterium]|nr:hypothetical protein [Chloroflexota bacterium]
MRSALFLTVAILLLLGILFARERVKLAFRVGAILYAIVLAFRFILFGRIDTDNLLDHVAVLAVFGAAWLAVWTATAAVVHYRSRRPPHG